MKHKPPPFIVALVVLGLIGGGGYWYFSNNPAAWNQAMVDFGIATDVEAETNLTASGFIEANEIKISSEIGGRIETLTVDQGDSVSAGEEVIRLDSSLIEAQTGQIEAQIALAEAQLAQIEAGLPQEQLNIAAAAIDLAEANRDAAHQAWQDAVLVRDAPQQLNAQIDAAYSQLAIIDLQIEQAALIRDALELRNSIAAEFWDLTQEGIDWSVYIPGVVDKSGHFDFKEGEKQQASVQWNLATMDVWQGWVNYENAKAARQATSSKLYTLQTLKSDPLQANLQVTQAEAEYNISEAAIPVAESTLAQLQAGVPQSKIGVLQANLESAKAQWATLEAQRAKYTVQSPIDGIVVQRAAHQGEIALPGSALLTVANLDKVTLTVFVADSDYGRLRVGQKVEVFIDSYPNEPFSGTITHINDEAEFTPKNVQTQEERVSLVYAIKITLPNESGKLNPGMPADAVFIEALER